MLSPSVRAQILDDVVKDEVTGGARVDHRDSITAVLAKGSHRMLVTVDEGGTVQVDRLERPGRRRTRFLAAIATMIAVLVILVLSSQLDILPV